MHFTLLQFTLLYSYFFDYSFLVWVPKVLKDFLAIRFLVYGGLAGSGHSSRSSLPGGQPIWPPTVFASAGVKFRSCDLAQLASVGKNTSSGTDRA